MNIEKELNEDNLNLENNNETEKKEINEGNNTLNNKDDYINNLELKIKETEKNNLEQILRLKAELDNVYKRNTIEIEKIYKFSLEKFFIELLPIIDNLERTNNELNNDLNINIIKEGIELILKSLYKVIDKFGIKLIDKTNVPFDPNLHQAVITLNDKSYPSNYVVKIMQKGYLLHERLIRPAMVQVTSNNNI